MAGSSGDSETLESLLNKATTPLNDSDDWDYILQFCDKVNSEADGVQTCTRLLAHKMQSPQEREALQALTVLEGCVKNCGENFHKELGKYRFLNELIKLVSPKYLGSHTSKKVQDKVIAMLFTWSVALTDQVKIRDAYQMLKKQGIVKVDPPFNQSLISSPVPPKPDNDILFTDKEKRNHLDKLLKSKNPEDLAAANRLIKNVVKEDDERMEKLKKRIETLEEVSNNNKLLNEMLEQFSSENPVLADMQTMKELYNGCQKLRPTLFRLASDTNDDEQALMEILRANDEVTRVMQMFDKLVQPHLIKITNGKTDGAPEPSHIEKKQNNSALFELSGLDINMPMAAKSHVNGDSVDVFNTQGTTALDDFDDNLLSFQSAPVTSSADNMSNLFNNLMIPQQPTASKTVELVAPPTHNSKSSLSPQSKPPVFADIDALSQALIEKSLGGRSCNTFPEPAQKLTLNELSSKSTDSIESSLSTAKSASNVLGDVDYSTFGSSNLIEGDTDTAKLVTEQPAQPFSLPIVPPIILPNPAPLSDSSVEQDFSLNDLFVALESIRPSTFPPLTAYDNNGIRVMIHFAKDHASSLRTDTLVAVVSIMSTRTNPVQNIVFQAAAPKVMKVKLQPPSSTELLAYNPIFSTPPLTQIMIVANPSKKEVKIRYKLDYKIDQQTSITENGLISGFPPVENWGKL